MRRDLIPTTPEGRLWHLAQECGEVIQAASKLAIFGPTATDGKTGISYDNVAKLLEELDDLAAAITRTRTDLSGERVRCRLGTVCRCSPHCNTR